jgi:predicted transcriptional regulator
MKAQRRERRSDGPPRAPSLFVHTDEQWDALASEPRHEVVQFLGALGPSSIAELASAMDAPADGLYHHVRRLLAAGIIRSVGERHTGRRREAIYDLAAQRLRFDLDIPSGRNINRLRAILRARLAHAEKGFERSLAARAIRMEEPLADSVIEGVTSWLDDESFEKVRRHLQSAVQIMAAGKRSRRGRLYSVTIVMNPMVRARDGGGRPTKRLAGLRSS